MSVNDATLQATAAYVAGSDEESGTATLTGHVNQESLVQLNLSGGTRQEIRNGPAGTWSGPDAEFLAVQPLQLRQRDHLQHAV